MNALKAVVINLNECRRHHLDRPCPECEAEETAERQHKEVERQKTVEEAHEWAIEFQRRHQEKPEKLLQAVGVGKRHLSCSFETFKGGESIKAVCKHFISEPSDIVLSGGTGSGKTHLSVAILRELVRSMKITEEDYYFLGKHDKACFITVPEILAEIRASYNGSGDEKEIIDKYSRYDFLVMDDIGAEKSTEWSITTLYLIIDRRYREALPTIYTTNLSINELAEQLSPRIASRLSEAKIVRINAPDHRKKR